MTTPEHIVIVGASLAGARAATALRREGYVGALTVIGDEPWMPYDRPPLSKQVLLGTLETSALDLVKLKPDEALPATFLLGRRAIGFNATRGEVTLDSGEVVQGTVIIATGTRARRLPFSADAALHTIRTRDDAVALVETFNRLDPGATVVVVGAGFIGAEVATAAQKRGLTPLVLESASTPLINVLGVTAAGWLLDLPSDFGVTVRTGVTIHDIVGDGSGLVVQTSTGDVLADAGVLGVGAVANTEWLQGSGLSIENGVVVDGDLRAAPEIYAIGDVARFPYGRGEQRDMVRIEHWQVANDHANHVAKVIMGTATEPFSTIPYFWSDQYGAKIQMLGHPRPSDDCEMVQGSVDERKWLAIYRRGDLVTGVLALNNPRELMLARGLLETT
jgi:NADPH-dependent 2,4-dienoyl-CoA reductase/sulfur reductase-like enzyme